MELGFLILTDYSESLNGKVYAMGAGWNMLRFAELPQEWNFGIAFGVDVPWDETNHRHALNLHIEDPDGERLGDELSFEVETGRPPGLVAGQDQRIVLSIGAQTSFNTAGPHAVVIRVGEDEVGRSRFYVLEVPPEMQPPQEPSGSSWPAGQVPANSGSLHRLPPRRRDREAVAVRPGQRLERHQPHVARQRVTVEGG